MRLSEKNFYKPLWIPLEKLPQLKLYPFEIRDRFILDLAKKLLP
jgi:hypothetical protein